MKQWCNFHTSLQAFFQLLWQISFDLLLDPKSQGTKSDSPRTSSKRLAQSLPTKVKKRLFGNGLRFTTGGALLVCEPKILSYFVHVFKEFNTCFILFQSNLAFWTSLVSMVSWYPNVKRIHRTGCPPLTIRRQVVFQRNNHRTRRSFKSCIADGLIRWCWLNTGSEIPKTLQDIFANEIKLNLDLCRWSLDPLVWKGTALD